MKETDKQCISCKLTCTFTLLGIGAYLVYHGRSQKSGKYALYMIGGGKKNTLLFTC